MHVFFSVISMSRTSPFVGEWVVKLVFRFSLNLCAFICCLCSAAERNSKFSHPMAECARLHAEQISRSFITLDPASRRCQHFSDGCRLHVVEG